MSKTKPPMNFSDLPYRVILNDLLQAAFADKANAENFIDDLCEGAITGDVISLFHGRKCISGFDADGNEFKL